MLEITTAPIGTGRERNCYVHPEDPRKAIKIPHGDSDRQNRRDLRFYKHPRGRKLPANSHIARFHGQSETNLGRGLVVDLIRDYDGQVSRPLDRYLTQGYSIETFEGCLIELKQWFLDNLIVFDDDLAIDNLLVQRTGFNSARLVAIGGLGGSGAFGWPGAIPGLLRRKINKRWENFIERVYRAREVRAQREAGNPDTQPHPVRRRDK